MKTKTITYAYAGVYTASVCLCVGKEKRGVTVEFTGGRRDGVKRKAEFTTSDPEIQEAIESRKDFGVIITVVDTVVTESEEPEKSQPKQSETTEGENEGGAKADDTLQSISEVSSVAKAKSFLMPLLDDEKKKELASAKSTQEVKDFAASCGYLFPDW